MSVGLTMTFFDAYGLPLGELDLGSGPAAEVLAERAAELVARRFTTDDHAGAEAPPTPRAATG